MDQATMAARLAALRTGVAPDAAPELAPLRHYRPLADAANEYATWSRSSGQRVYTGIREFDAAMRGIAPGELMVVQGYAHSGKTVFVTQLMLHNHAKRVALFTPDETRVLVLVKLTSILHGISAEQLEEQLAAGNSAAESMLRETAEHFGQLAVYEQNLALTQMSDALDEAERVWAAPAQLIIFDYADLLQMEGDSGGKISALKAWGKRRNAPLVVLHQSSRTAGRDGAKVKIDSGNYGGEQQALFVVGVRRKKNQYQSRIEELEEKIATSSSGGTDAMHGMLSDARGDLAEHRNTITFNLVKNKRPPSRLVDDVDYELDPNTGQISRWER